MVDAGGGSSTPRDAWFAFGRAVWRIYVLSGTVALLICLAAIASSHMGWLNLGWKVPNATEVLGFIWGIATWLALNSGEVIRVVSFGLLAWALFLAAMKMETIFNIVRGFNEARSPISQLQASVDGIRTTVREVATTVNGVRESAREFDKNIDVLKEFNDRFKALSDQVIGLQEETVSQRTDAVGPPPAGVQGAPNVINDEENWEELRGIWKRNNQRLERIIETALTGQRQRKYDNYPRTNYPAIIDRLLQDDVLSATAHEKSKDLHRMFMRYKPRNRPVTDEVVASARILDQQLSHLIDSEHVGQDNSEPTNRTPLATSSESNQKIDLVGVEPRNIDGGPDRQEGA